MIHFLKVFHDFRPPGYQSSDIAVAGYSMFISYALLVSAAKFQVVYESVQMLVPANSTRDNQQAL